MSTRKERRAARQQAANTLMTPEGVPIQLPIAGLGVRMGAQLADIAITTLSAICFVILLAATNIVSPQTQMAVFMLLFFLIRVPYYVLAELAWNGQTLGKKWMKIKVVSHDGGALQTHALVLRNLMKEAEIFLPGTLLLSLDNASPIASWSALAWVTMALLVPALDPYRRRFGDVMAGTHVVHLPQPILLRDLAAQTPTRTQSAPGPTFLPHQLDHYGAFELQTLEQVLRAGSNLPSAPQARNRHRATVVAIVEKVRLKIGYPDPVPEADAEAFLRAFYNAQRAHLEQRQLFGDRRTDKHHADQS